MARFKLGTCKCRCDDDAQRCLILVNKCGEAAISGATVKVYEAGTDNLLYTLATDSDGKACWDVAEGVAHYDVKATASGFDELSIDGDDEDYVPAPTYGMQPSSTGGIKFTIRGCNLKPLPGAVVTLAGGYTATTGDDGIAHVVPPTTGSYAYTITHPSGRFNSASGTATAVAFCNTATSVSTTLSAATGYQCCGIVKDGSTGPYPVSKTLHITTVGGTDAYTIAGCGTTNICLAKSMSDVGADEPDSVDCDGVFRLVPPDIATGTAGVKYAVTLADFLGNAALTETLRERDQAYLADGGCAGDSLHRRWRLVNDSCAGTAGTAVTRTATSYVVNSLPPTLSITFTIPTSTGYGPAPIATTLGGNPYSSTVVISEP